MKVALIIQARMGSSRLPGKSMMPLAGKPLVYRILERVKRCKKIDEIVLAIPDTTENLPLLEVGSLANVTVFSGPEDDLVERYYMSALASEADVIVRLPADNPVPEPLEIDRIVDYHLKTGTRGFSSNLAEIHNSGYPDGIGAEVFDFSLLEEVRMHEYNNRKREHVHLNFYDYATGKAVDDIWCPIRTIECPHSFRRPDLILDVNTLSQYQYMKNLYDALYPINPNFTILDIIQWNDSIPVAATQ